MDNFNFKSQICTTREQSERLLALGLKKETADMRWERISEKYAYYPSTKTPGLYYLARWNENTHVFEILDSACGYYRSALDYWMPIEPPKED